jgi:fibronectin-binding autotransporter adhesin
MKSHIAFLASAILSITYAHADDLTWNNGTATGNWNTTDANWTAATWNNATPDNAIFGAAGVGTVTLTEAITAGNITFNNAGYTIAASTPSDILTLSSSTITTAADAIISSVLAGSTGMTKSGAGMLSLTGVSTYSGGTVIDNGTLSLESTTTDTAIRGTVTVNSGGTLRIAGTNWGGFGGNTGKKIDTLNVVGGTVNHTLNFSFIKDAAVNMTGGTISGGEIGWRNTTLNSLASADTATVSSKISLRNDFVVANLAINTADGAAATDLLVSGAIGQASATNAPGLIKSGDGTLELTAISTFTGGTTVNGGNLLLNSASTSSAPVRGTVTVNTGATLTVSGGSFGGFGTTTGSKIDTLNSVGGSVVVVGNKMTKDATFNLTGASISGVSSGTIHMRNTVINSLASATASTISSALNIRADYSAPTLTIDTAAGDAASDLTITGAIGQSNPSNLIKQGDGTLELTAINSFTGGTTVNSGNLILNQSTTNAAIRGTVTVNTGATLTVSGASFGGFGDTGTKIDTLNVAGGSVVVVDQKMTNNSTFNLTGGTISGGLIHWRNSALNSLASATTSTVSSDLMIRPDFATPTLTINVADGTAETDLLVNGRIQQSTPSGNLVKTGAGTLKLSNNCSYTGTTTVSGGTLATDWYLASDDVTVADGATLAGNGGIGGNVTIQTGGHHALAVAAAAFQQVTRQIEGLLTLETGTFLDLSAAVPPAEGTYVLLTATGGITGTLPTVTGLSGNLTINGNNLEFTVTATPFSAWAQSRITDIDPVADATPTGDPDADGVNNLAEFAFNGDPLNGADNGYRLGQPTNVPSIGNALILTFATRAGADFGTGPTATADGVSYTVQGSLDLDAFTSPVTKVTPAIVPPGWPAVGDYEYHTFRLDASTGLAGKGFLRVKTEQ